MREFMLSSAFEKLEDIEDEWLADKAREALNNILSGKEKSIPWKTMKKRLCK